MLLERPDVYNVFLWNMKRTLMQFIMHRWDYDVCVKTTRGLSFKIKTYIIFLGGVHPQNQYVLIV